MNVFEPNPNIGHCHICDTPVPTHDLVDHIRVMHPEQYGEGPIRWPDGGYVVYDADPRPEDVSG